MMPADHPLLASQCLQQGGHVLLVEQRIAVSEGVTGNSTYDTILSDVHAKMTHLGQHARHSCGTGKGALGVPSHLTASALCCGGTGGSPRMKPDRCTITADLQQRGL